MSILRLFMPSESIRKHVIFVTDHGNITQLFIPVARALNKIAPLVEVILVDVSKLGGGENEYVEAENGLFLACGFRVEELGPYIQQETACERKQYICRIYELFRKLTPAVIVVPHEFGWAYDAIQVAKEIDIPTYHLAHAPWGPDRLGGDKPISKATRQGDIVPNLNHKAGILNRQKEVVASQARIIHDIVALYVTKVKCSGNKTISNDKDGSVPMWKRPYSENPYGAGTTRKGVCGPYYLRRLTLMGMDPATIDLVGNVRTDNFLAAPIKSYETICNKYKLDPGVKDLALLFKSPFELFENLVNHYIQNYSQKDAIIEVIKTLKELRQKMNILLLVHPREDVELYEKWLKDVGLSFVRAGKAGANHYSLYKHATVIIGSQSACLMEALLCNKPIVKLNYILYEDYQPQLVEGGAVIPVQSRVHLREQLDRALNDTPFIERTIANQAKVAFDLMYHFDGKCGERTANSLMDLMATEGS